MLKKFYILIFFAIVVSVTAKAQVKVIGAVEPNDLTDRYPTHNEIYGKGGFRSVDALIDRDAITPARRSVGMLVYVIANEKFYQLKAGVENTNWVETNFAGGTGSSLPSVIDITQGGTGATTADSARINLGLGTMAIQNKDAVEITNGAIDGTLIGNTAPALGRFTNLDVTTQLNVTGQVNVTGDIVATGDVTANSDIRIKKNILTLPNVSESLRKMHAVSYDRRDVELHQIGFIAQNVQEFFPTLIKTDTDARKTLSVNYQAMTVPLLKGWQEHDELIAKQQKEIVALKLQIAEMKALLDALKK